MQAGAKVITFSETPKLFREKFASACKKVAKTTLRRLRNACSRWPRPHRMAAGLAAHGGARGPPRRNATQQAPFQAAARPVWHASGGRFASPPHTRAENSCGTTRCAAGGRAQQPPAASPPPAPPATGPRDAHGNTTRHPRAAPKWPRTRARNASFARKICQCCTFVVILCRKYNII